MLYTKVCFWGKLQSPLEKMYEKRRLGFSMVKGPNRKRLVGTKVQREETRYAAEKPIAARDELGSREIL